MVLKVIGSGSAGNAYILENDKEALLIEAGENFDKIKQALNFSLAKVVGCIITHEHGDHAKSAHNIAASGIDLHATEGTLRALNLLMHHRAIPTVHGEEFKAGSFRISPFKIEHDAAEPVGFLIHHNDCGKVLFLTDSYYCQYIFNGLNNVIIEANYCRKIIDERVKDGLNPKFLRDRVITAHMSLDTCKKTLAANDLSQVNNIILIHLSDGNSNEKQFIQEVQAQTGKQVFVAAAGMVIPFNKTAF